MEVWDFKRKFLQIHIEKLQTELLSAGQNMTGPIRAFWE